MAPVQQPMVEKTYVAFDQIVQLIACDMPTIHSTTTVAAQARVQPLTLSVVVNEPHINSCQEIDQHCELSCAPSSKLTARNSFLIRRPVDNKQRQQYNNTKITTTDSIEYLKYGQDFSMECYASANKPLLVYSLPKNPFSSACNDNVFKVHGEMKQFVGLALQKANNNSENTTTMRHAMSIDESIPSAFFHWRLYHINPDMRFETIGENVPVCNRLWLFVLLFFFFLGGLNC